MIEYYKLDVPEKNSIVDFYYPKLNLAIDFMVTISSNTNLFQATTTKKC
jgi:hypothetical protein